MAQPPNVRLHPFRDFVTAFTDLLDREHDESGIVTAGSTLLAKLVQHDDWLPPQFALSKAERYQQYLLYRDAQLRFSVVSFVWGAGQSTPIHNHTTWGLVGMLRGSEISQAYALRDGLPVADRPPELLTPGDITAVSPRFGDIHKVSNALNDRDSISIHVYGADIGAVRRSAFSTDGKVTSFISGYANTVFPRLNEW